MLIVLLSSWRLAAFMNVFRSEINPRTEISIENASTGMFLKLLHRHVWMFSYLLSLNSLEFWRFVSCKTVSSSTNFDSSMSERLYDWNATSIGSKFAEGGSTSRQRLTRLCIRIQSAIMTRILLWRSEYRFRAAEWVNRTCLFVGLIFDWIFNSDGGFCSTISNWMPLATVVGRLYERSGTSSLGVTPTFLTTVLSQILQCSPSRTELAHLGKPETRYVLRFVVKIVLEFPSCLNNFNVLEQYCVCYYIVICCVWPYLLNFRLRAVFQYRTFHKNHFSVQIRDWWDAQTSSVLGQRWKLFDATALQHPEPFTYVLCTHRIQVLNYPCISEWIELQFVCDLRMIVHFQNFQFELCLDFWAMML